MRRFISLFFVLAVLLVSGLTVVQARPSPPSIIVSAKAGWVSTGWFVSGGEQITLNAHGFVWTGSPSIFPNSHSGPDGQGFPCFTENDDFVCLMDGVSFGALIGRIGLDGEPFFIGGHVEKPAPNSGELYLAVNDFYNYHEDNLGAFVVLWK